MQISTHIDTKKQNTMSTLFDLFAVDDGTSMAEWLHFEIILTMSELMIPHFLKNPDAPWDMKTLSRNRGLTEEAISAHPHLDWDWELVTDHPNISIEFIEKNPQLPWCFPTLSQSDKLTTEFIYMHLYDSGWDFELLSKSRALTTEIIDLRKNEDWALDFLCDNPSIPISYIRKNFGYGIYHDIHSVSRFSARATEEEVESMFNYQWSGTDLLSNPNISLEFIERHLKDIPGMNSGYNISNCRKINRDFVERHPEIRWNYRVLTLNPSIDIDFILSTPENGWAPLEMLLRYTKNPVGCAQRMIDLGMDVDLSILVQNINLTTEMILSRPHWNWNLTEYTFRVDKPVPLEIVERYLNPLWDWKLVSRHLQFPKGRAREIINRYLPYFDMSSLFLNESLTYEELKEFITERDMGIALEGGVSYTISSVYMNPKMVADALRDGKIPMDWWYFSSNPWIFA